MYRTGVDVGGCAGRAERLHRPLLKHGSVNRERFAWYTPLPLCTSIR